MGVGKLAPALWEGQRNQGLSSFSSIDGINDKVKDVCAFVPGSLLKCWCGWDEWGWGDLLLVAEFRGNKNDFMGAGR